MGQHLEDLRTADLTEALVETGREILVDVVLLLRRGVKQGVSFGGFGCFVD